MEEEMGDILWKREDAVVIEIFIQVLKGRWKVWVDGVVSVVGEQERVRDIDFFQRQFVGILFGPLQGVVEEITEFHVLPSRTMDSAAV